MLLGFLLCKTDSKSSIVPTSNANPHPPVIWNPSQELSIGGDQAALLQELRNSKVFRVCTGFLDGKSIAEAVTRPL